jgi:uncharacterized protein with ParB-like and HNH nuclease domain
MELYTINIRLRRGQEMKVANSKLKNFINKDVYFDIPYFQRYYDWDPFQCIELLTDIKELIDGKYKSKKNHFVGTFVFRKKKRSTNAYELIDGQQRITTLFLIAKAINFFAYYLDENAGLINHDELFNNNNNNIDGELKMHLRLNNEQRDQEAFESLILCKIDDKKHFYTNKNKLEFQNVIVKFKKNKEITNKKSKIFNNFVKILEWLKKSIGNYEQLMKFNEVLLNCDILELDLTKADDNPQNIFESLNSKSKQLDDCDLIKNYIFMNIPIEDDQKQLYDDYWANMESHVTKSKMVTFLKYYLMITLSRYIDEKEHGIFKVFKRNVVIDSPKGAKIILKEIRRWFYIYLASSNHISVEAFKYQVQNGNEEKLIQYKEYLTKHFYSYSINYSTLITMALIGLVEEEEEEEEDKENKFDFGKLKSILKIIDSYLIRWKIVKNQGNLSKPLIEFYQAISKNESNDYILSLKNEILGKIGQFKFFSDMEFESHLKNNPIRKGEQKILLSIIENHHYKKYSKSILKSRLNIEHISPINPSEYDEKNRNYDRDIRYIGNLLFIDADLNKKMGNLKFEEKINIIKTAIADREYYISNTLMEFYEYIENNKIINWNVNSILDRTEKVASEILVPSTKI